MSDDTEAATAVAATHEHEPVSLEQWADQRGISGKAVLTASEAAAVLRVSERSLRDMIDDGYLRPLRGLRIDTKVSLQGVPMVGDDFEIELLEENHHLGRLDESK